MLVFQKAHSPSPELPLHNGPAVASLSLLRQVEIGLQLFLLVFVLVLSLLRLLPPRLRRAKRGAFIISTEKRASKNSE